MTLHPPDPMDGLRSRLATSEERLRVLEERFRAWGTVDELQRDLAALQDRVRTLEIAARDASFGGSGGAPVRAGSNLR